MKILESAARLLLAIGLVAARAGGAEGPPSSASAIEARFRALRDAHLARWNEDLQALDRAESEAERRRLDEALDAHRAADARRFLELAREAPDDPVAADALAATVQIGERGPEAAAAIAELRRFAPTPRMRVLVRELARSPCPGVEGLLRDVLAKNPDRTARGLACQGLAELLARHADLPRLRAQDPETARTLERVYGAENLDEMAGRDAEATLREAEALHEQVIADFADVRLFPEDPDDARTIGKASETWLAARRELAVGRKAPEIEGEGVDGRPLKLGDYRGKVVAVVFWASWCGPCMAQVPHERELVERLKGRPFALLGVNGDRSREEAGAAVAKAGITWPNWFDGDPGDGPIAARWRVTALPRIYVLDAEGTIRFQDVRGEALGRAVDELLGEMADGSTPATGAGRRPGTP